MLGRHAFKNMLPEPPMDPKFLKQAEELHNQVKYKTTSLEARYKHPILTEADLGITVNLIDPRVYHAYDEDNTPQLHPTDDFLAHAKVDPPGTKKKFVRPQPRVAWLRKTEYMANELYEPAQKFKSQLDTMAGFREQAKRKDVEAHKTLDDRLADIEASFEHAKEPPVHTDNTELQAVKILPVLPAMDLWSNQYTAIMFDDDAYSASGHTKAEAQKALMKGFRQSLEEGVAASQFLGYMLPTKRKREDNTEDPEADGEPSGDYDWIRTYSFTSEPDERHIIIMESEASATLPFVMCQNKLNMHRVVQMQTHAAAYHPSEVHVKKRRLRAHERNARGRRKRTTLDEEYETEPDSEPEEPASNGVEHADDKGGDISGTEEGEGAGGEAEAGEREDDDGWIRDKPSDGEPPGL